MPQAADAPQTGPPGLESQGHTQNLRRVALFDVLFRVQAFPIYGPVPDHDAGANAES